MKASKLLITSLMAISVMILGVSTPTDGLTGSALAKTKAAKVVKTTNYKSKHKVHVRGGRLYTNSKLTHSRSLSKYLYTKFYATKQVTVRQANGKQTTLKYVTSKNGQLKGYAKANNVWNQWGYGKYSVTAYRKNALTAINRDRAKRGLKPLKETAKLDKIAQKNSKRMLKEGKKFKVNVEGTPHAGWIVDDYLAPKSNPIVHYENGAQWGQGAVDSWIRRSDRNRDIGAIPYLMSQKHTQIGLGGTQHGEAIYMFVLLSNH